MQINMIPFGDAGDFGDTTKLISLLTKAVKDEVAEGQRFMQIYPAWTSPNYKRTGTLRRSWSGLDTVKVSGGIITAEIGSNSNIAPYNEQVQGEEQLPVFQTIGWKNVDDLDSKVNREFPQLIQDAIDEAYGG